MNKELKRQIKEDELLTGMGQAVGWLGAHREQVRLGAIVAGVVVLGALALAWFSSSRKQQSEAAFAEALASYHAPLSAGQPAGAPPPTGPSFVSAQEKYAKALSQFEGVSARWGSSDAGQRARYYAALCRLELGQSDEARKALEALGTSSDKALAAQARLSLARLQAGTGQVDAALESLRKLAAETQPLLPRDFVLMTLASTLEEAQRVADAAKAYEDLALEYPESGFAAEARRRADYLKNRAS